MDNYYTQGRPPMGYDAPSREVELLEQLAESWPASGGGNDSRGRAQEYRREPPKCHADVSSPADKQTLNPGETRRRAPPGTLADAGVLQANHKKKIPPQADFGERDFENTLAHDEALAISKGRLEEEAAWKEHRRNQAAKGHLHYAALSVLIAFTIGMVCAIFVFFAHMLAPERLRYLTASEFERVHNLIFSGLLIALAKKYLDRHL